jgi:hypothetical protein
MQSIMKIRFVDYTVAIAFSIMFVYFISCDGLTFMEKLDTNLEKKCTRSNSMMTFHNNSKITCTKEKDIKKGQHVLNLISLLKFPHIINQYELNYMKCLHFLQACRTNPMNHSFDSMSDKSGLSEDFEPGLSSIRKVPVEADFLFAYSTVPGIVILYLINQCQYNRNDRVKVILIWMIKIKSHLMKINIDILVRKLLDRNCNKVTKWLGQQFNPLSEDLKMWLKWNTVVLIHEVNLCGDAIIEVKKMHINWKKVRTILHKE